MKAHQFVADISYRIYGPFQQHQIALQLVKAFHGLPARTVLKNGRLQHIETRLQAVDDRDIVIDDKIHDRIQGKSRPFGQLLRHRLATLPDFAVTMRIAVPDRHQKTRSQENMGFPEFDLISRKLGGVQHHEQRVTEFLYFRTLMRRAGIFDSQVMQPEFLLDFGQQLAVRLEQTQPDKSVLEFQHFTDVLDGHIADTDAILVGHALHDHAVIDVFLSLTYPSH